MSETSFQNRVIGVSPHAAALGIEVIGSDSSGAEMKAPYDEKLIGDPETGVIAGGVITALLDHCCGSAVGVALGRAAMIATLDLRIDYMRPATPGQTIFARAECTKITRHIAFVRALAHDGEADDPVATAQAAFMIVGERPTP